MGNGAAVTTVDGLRLSRKDFDQLDRLCRSQHFRDNFKEYAEAFRRAIESDALDMLELLIPAGNAKMVRPLHIACKLSRLESAEVLLSAGFSCMLQDELGRTPLHVCSISPSHHSGLCATLLALSGKKALVMRDRDGLTPLHLAIAQNNLRVIEALMNNGADVTVTDTTGKNGYQIAADNNNMEALQLLKDLVSKKTNALQKTNTKKSTKNSGRPQTQAEIDRIMQVWERFFKNAFKRMGLNAADLETEEDYYGASPSMSARTVHSASGSSRRQKQLQDGSESDRRMNHSTKLSAYQMEREELYRYAHGTSAKYDRFLEYEQTSHRSSKVKAEKQHSQHNDISHSGASSKKNASTRVWDTRTMMEWFEWVVMYQPPDRTDWEDWQEDAEAAGAYYVLNKRTGETAWLEDHVAAFVRSTLLPLGDWSDFDLHMSLPLPTSLSEAVTQGWLTYYTAEDNTCRWISIPTKCTEDYLPLGYGEEPHTLRELNFEPYEGDPTWCAADATCSAAWVMVVAAVEPDPRRRRGGYTEEDQETCCYYRNRVTGATSWDPPPGWEALVETSWGGWTLCCGEDAPDDLYWCDLTTGESMWAEI